MEDREQRFFEAVKAGDAPKVEALLAEDPGLADVQVEGGLSAVVLAAYAGHKELAQLLLERGAQIDIFEAAVTGSLAHAIAQLNEFPALANAVAPDGFQPLGLAAFFGQYEAAALLIARGALVNTPSRNPMRVSPLGSAAAGQHLEVCKLLLEAGADPNARQTGGFSPLHSAAQNGQEALVDLLLAYGAEPGARSNDSLTPADLARQAGHTALAERLAVGS